MSFSVQIITVIFYVSNLFLIVHAVFLTFDLSRSQLILIRSLGDTLELINRVTCLAIIDVDCDNEIWYPFWLWKNVWYKNDTPFKKEKLDPSDLTVHPVYSIVCAYSPWLSHQSTLKISLRANSQTLNRNSRRYPSMRTDECNRSYWDPGKVIANYSLLFICCNAWTLFDFLFLRSESLLSIFYSSREN